MNTPVLTPVSRPLRALNIGSGTALTAQVRAGKAERGVALAVMFVVAYNLPQFWLTKVPLGSEVRNAPAADNLVALILVLAAAFAFVNLRCDPMRFVDLARAEPLLPAFLGLAIASALWSGVPYQTFEVALSLAILAGFAYWLVIRFSLGEIIGLATVVTSIGAFLHWGIAELRPEYGTSNRGWIGVMDHRNNLGASCALGVMLALFTARIYRRYRVPAYAMAVVNGYLVLRTNSKTALVTLIAIPVMMILFSAFRARRTLYAVVAVTMVAGAATVVAVALQQLDSITAALDRDQNLTGRTEIWEAMIPEIGRRPLLGFGWAGYFTGWKGPARDLNLQFDLLPHAHNAWLEYAIHLGLVGALLWTVLFVRLVVRGARVVRFYEGAAGLFPLVFAGYVLLQSISEAGVVGRGLPFLLLVVAVSAAGRGRRDYLQAHRSVVPSSTRSDHQRGPHAIRS